MKKIKTDTVPDKLLPMKNGYKIAAATWIIDSVLQNIGNYTAHLNSNEQQKVRNEVDKLLDGIRTKRVNWNK